jgi:hypothetical protein
MSVLPESGRGAAIYEPAIARERASPVRLFGLADLDTGNAQNALVVAIRQRKMRGITTPIRCQARLAALNDVAESKEQDR